MASICVVVVEVRAYKPDKMLPAKDNHMIEHLLSAVADPSLRDAILPWTSVSGSAGFDTHGLDESDHLGAEDRILVEYQVLWCRVKGECLTQLLDHPCRRRGKGRVEMQNAPSAMVDDEKFI